MEIYLGSRIEHASERLLLQEIDRLAGSNDYDAIVFVNVSFGGRQMDAILCFEGRAIVLEAKGLSRPVRGAFNGLWQLQIAEDRWKNIVNPYQQALTAKNALRDTMRAFDSTTEPAYPSAAVVITPDLPSGSTIPRGDFKVTIAGLPALAGVIQAASNNSWPLDRWRAFAQHHFLTRITSIEAAFDARIGADEQLLSAYSEAFTRTYAPVAKEQIPFDCKIGTGATIPSADVVGEIGAGASLLVCGPSGCGKSLLAVSAAVAAVDQGAVSIILPAKHYETSIKALLNREVGLLAAPSAGHLLAAAQRSNRAILLVVDGYNECTAERQGPLTRCLMALHQRYGCSLVVTSRTQLERADLVSLRSVDVLPPSTQIKRLIASQATGGQPLSFHVDWLLGTVTSGLEARLVGEVGQTLESQPSRHRIFDAFARRRLGSAASVGIRALATIAKWLSDHLTFSVSTRTIDRILMPEDSQAELPSILADLGLISLHGERLSFSHEMFFHAFAAEAVVRTAAGHIEPIIEALRDARHADRLDLIIGAIDDVSALEKILGYTSDATLIGACLGGACGRFPREWVEAQYPRILARVGDELTGVSCDFIAGSPWPVSVSTKTPMSRVPPNGALLQYLPELVVRGRFLADIWECVAQFDEHLQRERIRLREDALQAGVGLKNSMFGAAYVMAGPDAPALSGVCLGLHHGLRHVSHAMGPQLEQLAAAEDLTPGQLYVWANLCKQLDDRTAISALTNVVTELIEQYAARAPYHVQLALVDAANHCLGLTPQRDERLIDALKALLSDRNIGLNSSIIEVLERLGEMELDQPELSPAILDAIDALIRERGNSARWPEAFGVFSQQFDGPYSDTYYQVVQGLPPIHRKALYEMAAKGAEYPDLFLPVLLLDLATFNDLETEAAFQHWTGPPRRDFFMPQTAIEVFVVAHVALARLRGSLPPREISSEAEAAALACGKILYWSNHADVAGDTRAHSLRSAWSTLESAEIRVYALNLIAACSNLMIRSTDQLPGGRATLSLAESFPEETTAICRTGLECPEALAGYFQYYHDSDRRRDQMFALQVLGRYGRSIDLPLLRRLAQSSALSRSALDAIRTLEDRLNDPKGFT